MNSNTSSTANMQFEDVFFCIEVLSQARAALCKINPLLAAKLEKVTSSFMYFYESANETIGSNQGSAGWDKVGIQSGNGVGMKKEENISGGRQSDGHAGPGSCEVVVDVLTGEVIGKFF